MQTRTPRYKTLKVNIPNCGSQGPLHSLIDSTGIKGEGKGGNISWGGLFRIGVHLRPR